MINMIGGTLSRLTSLGQVVLGTLPSESTVRYMIWLLTRMTCHSVPVNVRVGQRISCIIIRSIHHT